MLLLSLPMLVGAAAPVGRLEVSLVELRNQTGVIRLCLTQNSAFFPDCTDDPLARKLAVPARDLGTLSFSALASGGYALTVIHDENGNKRLDTFARIPREGFGFSRNPALRFGPPRFDQVEFTVGAGETRQKIRMNYLL